jgi:nucleoid-associated protein YgaU
MARVIVILTLMILITTTMFAITRTSSKPTEAVTGPSATVKLGELPRSDTPAPPPGPQPAPAPDADEASLTSAGPRPVTNVLDAPPQSAQDVTKGPVAGAAPSVGTAGIDHKSKASFTGTATPGDTVSLVWDGKTVGTTKADANGNWEIELKAPVTKAEHELYVSAQAKDGSVIIGPQRATIRPPASAGGLPRITLKAADQTPTTLQEGTVAAEAKTGLVVEKIVAGEPGITVLTGKADPGATVRAAINGKASAETRVAEDGTWLLAAPNLSGRAAKGLRLQLVDSAGAKIDETELPYDVPATAPKLAVKETKVATDFPSVLSSKPAKGDAVKDDLAAMFHKDEASAAEPKKAKIIRVRRGDSLWRISKRHLGNGKRWAAFYKANKKKIDNPNLIFPGQTLIIPG